MDRQKDTFPCEVREVYSGDDLVVLVDLGIDGLHKRMRVRLYGVDTPNGANNGDDTPAGLIRKEVRALTRYKRAQLRVITRGQNSWICVLEVETDSGRVNLNELLIQQGHVFKGKK